GYALLIRPTYALPILVVLAVLWRRDKSVRSLAVFLLAGIVAAAAFLIPYVSSPDKLHQVYLVIVRFNLDIYGTYVANSYGIVREFLKHLPVIATAIAGSAIVYRAMTDPSRLLSRVPRASDIRY